LGHNGRFHTVVLLFCCSVVLSFCCSVVLSFCCSVPLFCSIVLLFYSVVLLLGGFVELGHNGRFHTVWRSCGQISVDGISFAIDEKFGEIPGNSSSCDPSHCSWLLPFEELPQRMSVVTIDVNFGVKVKSDVIFRQDAGFDLGVGSRLLASKLIAGESGDSQPLSFIASVQSLKLIVVGVGQTSVGCHVQDDHDFASVLVETDAISIDGVGSKIVNGLSSHRRQEGAE